MKTGEDLFRFPASLMLQRFYGTVRIRSEGGKVTHVETETQRTCRYRDLPRQRDHKSPEPWEKAAPRQ